MAVMAVLVRNVSQNWGIKSENGETWMDARNTQQMEPTGLDDDRKSQGCSQVVDLGQNGDDGDECLCQHGILPLTSKFALHCLLCESECGPFKFFSLGQLAGRMLED